MSISAIEAQIDESDAGSDDTLKAEKGSSSGVCSHYVKIN